MNIEMSHYNTVLQMDRWTVLEIDAIFVSFGFFVSKVREPLSWRFKK